MKTATVTATGTTTQQVQVVSHYHYDGAGRLIGETDGTGAVVKEYVALGGLPLAVIDNATGTPVMYAVHTDHLGTPRTMTDATGAEVWRIDARPFGETVAITGTAANDNRFPGQVFDAESGLHYNYFRDYDPTLGRYLQSDPIGLGGGLNTYAYVKGNPVRYADPYGLKCTYSQSTGQMICVDDGTGQTYYNEQGYSGTGSGRNNPDMQDVPNVGPIPRGAWEWGSIYNSRNTGPNTVILTPSPENECEETPRDCSSFRAHGNNSQNDASQGCIVLPPNRTQIPTGETVEVVR